MLRVLKWLDAHFEEVILAFTLFVMFFIMQLQIVMRIVSGSLSWVEELSRYLFVFSGFLSVSYTIKKKIILNVDIVTEFFPKPVRDVLGIVIMAVTGAFFSYLFYHSIGLIGKMIRFKQSSAAMGMPMWWLYFVASVGFGLVILRCLQDIVKQIRAMANHSERSARAKGDIIQ